MYFNKSSDDDHADVVLELFSLVDTQLVKTDMDEQISSSAPSLMWCSPTSYSMCYHSNSATMMMHIPYFIYM